MSLAVKRTGNAEYGRYIKALICGFPGAGKALAAETPVPTEKGWKPIHEIVIGDRVLSEDGKWIDVVGVYPQGIRELYRVKFSDGSWLDCDLDHLWTVEFSYGKNRKQRSTKTVTLRDLLEEGIVTTEQSSTRKNFWIPVIQPADYPEKNLPIDPYTLGCLLGDGSFRTRSVMFSTQDPEIFEYMDLNTLMVRHVAAYDYIISEPPGGSRLDRFNFLRAELEWFGLWGLKSQDKFIPDIYMMASVEQRQELVRGLMDTDGTIADRGEDKASTICFGSSSARLVEQFAELLYSLGCVTGRYSKGITIKETEHLDHYRVNATTWFNPFKIQRKADRWKQVAEPYRRIASVEPVGSGQAVCIKVDSPTGLFAAKDYIVTHNTLLSSTFVNPFYASAEGGLMSIADRNIPYIDIKTSADLLAFKHAVDQDPKTRQAVLGFPVDTVVVDTIDEIQRILIRERLEEQKKESMALQDWGWLGEQMQAIIRGFRNLPLNVVFTCHLKESQDSDSGRVWMEPGLQGAIAGQIPAAVDLALLLRTTTVAAVEDGQAVKRFVRLLVSQPDAQHRWIKDRSGKLPPEIEVDFESDYKRIFEYIYGDLDTETIPEPTIVSEVKTVTSETELPDGPPDVTPEVPTTVVTSDPAELEEPQVTESSSIAKQMEETVVEAPKEAVLVCEECGVEVDKDRADISRIRFRRVLCLEDFKAEGRK